METLLPVPPLRIPPALAPPPVLAPPHVPERPRPEGSCGFGPGRALLVLAVFLGVQILFSMAAGVVAGVTIAAQRKPLVAAELQRRIEDFVLLPGIVWGTPLAAAAAVTLAWAWGRDRFRDGSSAGFGVRAGAPLPALVGVAIGAALALLYLAAALAFAPSAGSLKPGPLARLATMEGAPRAIWLIALLVLAPPVEEVLFRGVLLGGLRSRLSDVKAVGITTFIFAGLHVTEAGGFWPAMTSVVVLGVVLCWLRIRTGSLLPGLFAHTSYNLVIALAAYRFLPPGT